MTSGTEQGTTDNRPSTVGVLKNLFCNPCSVFVSHNDPHISKWIKKDTEFTPSEIKYSTDFGYILYYKLKFAKCVQVSTVQNKFSTISWSSQKLYNFLLITSIFSTEFHHFLYWELISLRKTSWGNFARHIISITSVLSKKRAKFILLNFAQFCSFCS